MKIQKFLFKNKNGEPSITLTAFSTGFLLVNFKLIMSGITFSENFKFETFSGVDYAAALAALGSVYVLNKGKSQGKKEDENAS